MTEIELSLFMMGSCSFVKMLKQQLYAVPKRLFDRQWSQHSEPQQFRIYFHPSDQSKACSEILSCIYSEKNQREQFGAVQLDVSSGNLAAVCDWQLLSR